MFETENQGERWRNLIIEEWLEAERSLDREDQQGSWSDFGDLRVEECGYSEDHQRFCEEVCICVIWGGKSPSFDCSTCFLRWLLSQ